MNDTRYATKKIAEIAQLLTESAYFHSAVFGDAAETATPQLSKVDIALNAAKKASHELKQIADFLHDSVVTPILQLDHRIQEPEDYDQLRRLIEKLLMEIDEFRSESALVSVYGELLSIYILTLYRCGSPDRDSPIIRSILKNIVRRKAIELDHNRLSEVWGTLEDKVTIAIISKRYAAYVLATKGLKVLFRSEIEFRTFGTSPEALALQITNILLRNGIKLSDVTDVVCGGGDMGTLPDGIYVLTDKVRDESWKRLHNSSLNRGALIAWELRNLLRPQGEKDRINAVAVQSVIVFDTWGS